MAGRESHLTQYAADERVGRRRSSRSDLRRVGIGFGLAKATVRSNMGWDGGENRSDDKPERTRKGCFFKNYTFLRSTSFFSHVLRFELMGIHLLNGFIISRRVIVEFFCSRDSNLLDPVRENERGSAGDRKGANFDDGEC